MASGGYRYTLVGFSEEIDRRPLVFLERLPATKLCSACGVVPSVVALQPCGHVFCKPCNQQCKRRGGFACPLDQDVCSEEELVWINHPARSIMGKQVLCWNQAFGCDVVKPASDISKHFHHECLHHLACCTICGVDIIAADVCAHLESKCDPSTVSSENAVIPRQTVTPEAASQGSCSDAMMVIQRTVTNNLMATSSIEAQLKKMWRALRVGAASGTCDDRDTGENNALKRFLQEALSEMKIHMTEERNHLDELMQTVTANLQTFQNSLTEKNEELLRSLNGAEHSGRSPRDPSAWFSAFTEAVLDGLRGTKAELERLSSASDSKCREMGEMSRNINALKETLNNAFGQTSTQEARISALTSSSISSATSNHSGDTRNVFARILSAMPLGTKHQWVIHESRNNVGWCQPVYLRGYRVSLLARIIDKRVKFSLRLHKGEIDEFLEWPFQLKMKFSVLHPQTTEELHFSVTPNLKLRVCYSRPLQFFNPTVVFEGFSFECADLKSRGFIKDNQIILCFSIEDEKTARK